MDNKSIIDKLSKDFDMKREETQGLLNDFYKLVADSCIDMDSVVIPGFGQFEPKKRKERVSVHPSSGKRLMVPPKLVISFRPSGLLKSKVK